MSISAAPFGFPIVYFILSVLFKYISRKKWVFIGDGRKERSNQVGITKLTVEGQDTTETLVKSVGGMWCNYENNCKIINHCFTYNYQTDYVLVCLLPVHAVWFPHKNKWLNELLQKRTNPSQNPNNQSIMWCFNSQPSWWQRWSTLSWMLLYE